jgi:hypothetical protein
MIWTISSLAFRKAMGRVSCRSTGNRAAGFRSPRRRIWSGWDGVGTAAVTLVGPIAYFTRVG